MLFLTYSFKYVLGAQKSTHNIYVLVEKKEKKFLIPHPYLEA